MVEIVWYKSWCGYDATIYVIENHTPIAVQWGRGVYRINNIAAAILDANRNL